MPNRIEKLRLENFRGATCPVEIEFDTTKPAVMVFGENGTGKSTIVDAIDFVCNGNIGSLEDRSIGQSKAQHLPALNAQATPYLILDARYEKARIDGIVRDVAVLIAIGVQKDGKRTVLGVSAALSEAEVHWREFLMSLAKRGIHGLEMITSDDHKGLAAARKAVFASVPWQRCQFHLQQNARAYVPRKSMVHEVAEDIRDVFDAPDRHRADQRLKETVTKYAELAPLLASWMEANIPEGLSVFKLPEAHQKRLRTSNWLENLNGKIKKRTSVVGLFPSVESVLRLVSAVLMETDERWLTGKRYLNMNTGVND